MAYRTRHFLFAGVLVALAVFGRADEAAAEGEDEESYGNYASQYEDDEPTNKIFAHPDVRATYIFPDFGKPRFPMGENVDALVGFMNAGSKLFNITHVTATLNNPYDFSYIVQNFSTNVLHMALRPGEERSVLYSFTPDGRLEALDFTLCLLADYVDEQGAEYRTVLFNGTATLVESSRETSSKIMFVLTMLSVIAAIAGWKAYERWSKYDKKAKKKALKAQAEAALRSEPQISEDWLAGQPGMKSTKEKKAKGGASGGSKPRSKK